MSELKEVRSLFIATPGIEECSNYLIIQRLIEHRIRCTLIDDTFSDITKDLVLKFLAPPDNLTTQQQLADFVNTEALAVLNTFNLYEKLPDYQEAITRLKEYVGKPFKITSVTFTGIQVLIDL